MSSEQESPHVTAAKNQWELNKKAKKRIRVAGGKVEVYEATLPAQDIGIIVADAEKRAREESARLIAAATPGQMIKGHGIYLGTWSPVDNNGCSLRKTFNVFAAPDDLPGMRTYNDTVNYIAGLKGWNDYDGTNYANDKELRDALKRGDYKGGWIIPPRDILCGMDADDNATMPDNLLAHKDKCALKEIFSSILDTSAEKPGWYWSSTEISKKATEIGNNADRVYDIRLPAGNWFWNNKNGNRLSCRPVRLEPIP